MTENIDKNITSYIDWWQLSVVVSTLALINTGPVYCLDR